MKNRKFSCVDYMFTPNHNEVKDMYKGIREVYPNNILKFEKSHSGMIFIAVYDFVFVEE